MRSESFIYTIVGGKTGIKIILQLQNNWNFHAYRFRDSHQFLN